MSDSLAADLTALPPDELAYLDWQARWTETARSLQLPPDPAYQREWVEAHSGSLICEKPDQPWSEMGYQAGRGFGKTRVGAEWMGRVAYECKEGLPYAVVAPTQNDVRFTCFEGQSGLLNIIPKECVKRYRGDDLLIELTNGATIRGFSAEKAERLRGPEHAAAWCFIAGTQVATPTGDRPIEALRPGDMVLTRKGPRRVLANSKRLADVGRVTFSTGAELVGTTDHPVYTPLGWTDLGRLQQGDEVCAITASSGAASVGIGTASGTTSGQTSRLSRSARSTCTALFGPTPTALSLRATTSITSTATDGTTASRTLSVCLTAHIERTTAKPKRTQQQDCGGRATSRTSAHPAEHLSCVGRIDPAALASGVLRALLKRAGQSLSELARTAEPASDHAPETFAASVASTWRPQGRQFVYCLKVEGEPEYFANGVLVHNCDEIAAWGKDAEYTLDMLQMGLRIGAFPRLLWTSTPKPTQLVRTLTTPKPGRIIVRGATFDNRANLADKFLDNLEKYEGTKIGRQELYGELIDPEEAGIVRRSQFNLWPAKRPLPAFDWIIMSLDTAYTEKTVDTKGDPDPTACGVWGVFHYKGMSHVMLLDCWEDHLGLPDLMKRVKKELNTSYGDDADTALIKPMFGSAKPLTSGRKPDILLIEDKGSGISLRQMLERAGIEAYAYNPGRADKLARLHIVSPIFAAKRVWLPESEKHPGKPRTWCDPLVSQLCSFAGEGSIKHDDHVDQTTQALRVMLDKGLLKLVKDRPPERGDRPPPKPYSNPYAA